MQQHLLRTALLLAIVWVALSNIITAPTAYSKETSLLKIVFQVA